MKFCKWITFCAVTLLAVWVTAFAQIPGPNVSVISGIQDRFRGDMFLQRQNEPAIAAFVRNPDHLLAAANDYRTVDFAGDPNVKPAAEAWIGVYRSYDRGRTWFGGLLPGFPQDTSPAGTSSPLFGLAAGSDPVLATDTSGHAYLGGLAFDRGGMSRMFVSRYTDRNDLEGGESIYYDFTKIVDLGTVSGIGIFVDKPAIAVDVPRIPGAAPGSCGTVYFSYTIFDGEDKSSFRSKVMVSTSKDCGVTWSRPYKVNRTYNRNQGTALAIDPRDGTVYVTWRTFAEENGVMIAKSTDGGLSFSDPVRVTGTSGLASFDQPTSGTTFRTNGFPTVAVDGAGRVYVAWQERLTALVGSPRITIATSRDSGATWTPRRVVEQGGVYAHQVMPALSFSGGQLGLLFYDFRADGRDLATINGSAETWIAGIDRKVEVRFASATPGPDGDLVFLSDGNPRFNASVQVSQYVLKANTVTPEIVEIGPGLEAINRPNYPMYSGGTVPFFGDYIWLAPAVPYARTAPNDPSGLPWRWTSHVDDSAARSFHAIWTDTRDVIPPLVNVNGALVPKLSGDWTQYAPPGTGQLSCTNPGSRNANIYTSEISPGLVAGSPQTFKRLTDDTGVPVQHAFVMYVENRTSTGKFVRLTIQDNEGSGVPAGQVVDGSFLQFSDQETVDLELLRYSSIYRTVYVSSPIPTASVRVDVQEISAIGGSPIQGGLVTSVTFNPDPTNPQSSNVQVATKEVHNPQISNPQISNPQISNPQISNPQISNPQISNPQISNPQISNTSVTDVTWTVSTTLETNTASAYSFITNVENAEELLAQGYQFQLILYRVYLNPGAKECLTDQSPQDEVISTMVINNPQISNPQISNPQISNPQVSNPQISNPQISNATFSISPASAGSSSHDGTTHAPRLSEAVKVTLRVFSPPGKPPLHQAGETVDRASQAVFAQAADTGKTEAGSAFYDKTPPVVFATVDPAPNASGWNNTTPVTVKWSVSDSGSGIVSKAGCDTISLTNETSGTTITCAATNGAGLFTTASVTVRIDKSGPMVSAVVTPTPNASGWNNSNLEVKWNVSDSESGISSTSGCDTITVTGETAGTTYTCTATNKAGVSASGSVTIKLDKTPPNPPVPGVSPTPNVAGWNNSTPVTVSFTSAGDAGAVQSGVASCTAADSLTSETSGTIVSGSCTDVAGNTSAATSVTVKIDKTPPNQPVPGVSPTPNAAGWNNSIPVTVSFASAGDAGAVQSGVAGCTAADSLTSETSGTIVSGSCTDVAGNTSAATAVTVKIDKTPPNPPTAAVSPSPNAAGWNNSTPVTVSFGSAGDAGAVQSGVASCTAANSLTAETAGTLVSGNCTDLAGNTSTGTSVTVRIDKTPPVLSGSRSPTANANGWNNSDVTVSFTASDALSGVATGPLTPQVVITEGTGQSRSATCTDTAGNTSSATVNDINIDKTLPAVTIAAPAINASYFLKAIVASSYNCNDALSGIATCSGPVSSGAAFNTNTAGAISFTVTASDKAGNATQAVSNYYVNFVFTGFLSPLKTAGNLAAPTYSGAFNLGKAIPIKWQLKDATGAFLNTLNFNKMLKAVFNGASGPCTGMPAVSEIMLWSPTSGATGGSTFRYDTGNNQFIFNWDTSTGVATGAGCYTIVLELNDGSAPKASTVQLR